MSQSASRRSAPEWQQLIMEQRQSGETRDAFCKSRGISPTAFQSALGRQRERGKFIEVQPVPQSSRWEGEVSFPGGITVRVRGC